jgi:hypothetical protein
MPSATSFDRRLQLALLVCLLLTPLVLAPLFVGWKALTGPIGEMKVFQGKWIGKSEADFRRRWGEPKHVVEAAEAAGRKLDFPWAGMNFRPIPQREVTHRVLLYSHASYAAYVFIEPDGRVSEIYFAGT